MWWKSLLIIICLDLNPALVISLSLTLNPFLPSFLCLNFFLSLYLSLFGFFPSWIQFLQLLFPSLIPNTGMTNWGSLDRVLLSLFNFCFIAFGHLADPLRNRTAWDLEQVSKGPHNRLIFISKESDSTTVSSCTTCSTNSMNISQHGIWEIIIYDKIGVLEIDTSSYQVSRNQGPILSLVKFLYDLLSLLLWFLSWENLQFLFSANCWF